MCVNSSICAIIWLVNEFDITNDGCPVALPRLSSRPSESTMIAWPSGKTHSSTCGLMLTLSTPSMTSSPAMSISLSKWPMLPTIAWCFIRAMWSAVMMSLLPVAVTKMSAVSTTSSSVAHLVALHRRLQRADRVDLGDDHARALAAQRLARSPCRRRRSRRSPRPCRRSSRRCARLMPSISEWRQP